MRSIQRKPTDERWNNKAIDMVKFAPWRPSKDDPNMDGERADVIKLTHEQGEVEREVAGDTVPGRATINKEDVEIHGYTATCPGCMAILRGTARQGHSEE